MTEDQKTKTKTFRWDWAEVWATLGVSAAACGVIAALFYGYSL